MLRNHRRGTSALTTVFGSAVLIGATALAVDGAYVLAANAECQHHVDAAAAAASVSLDLTEEGMKEAETVAQEYLNRAQVFKHSVTQTGPVVFGYYDDAGNFVETNDPALAEIAQVSAAIDGLGLFFAPAASGMKKAQIKKEAAGPRDGATSIATEPA